MTVVGLSFKLYILYILAETVISQSGWTLYIWYLTTKNWSYKSVLKKPEMLSNIRYQILTTDKTVLYKIFKYRNLL